MGGIRSNQTLRRLWRREKPTSGAAASPAPSTTTGTPANAPGPDRSRPDNWDFSPSARRDQPTTASTTTSTSAEGTLRGLDVAFAVRSGRTSAPAHSVAHLPPDLKAFALQIEAQWGDGHGEISAQALRRFAQLTSNAIAFFVDDAKQLLALTDALGQTQSPLLKAALVDVKAKLAALTPAERERAKPFRVHFDAAVSIADAKGPAALIRDAAHHNPRYHQHSIVEHTTLAVAAVNALASSAGIEWKDAGAVMLLHDVGKMIARNTWSLPGYARPGEKNWNFTNHEAIGADWLKSRGLDDSLVWFVRRHGDFRTLTSADIQRLSAGDRTQLQRYVLVGLADLLAKGNSPDLVVSAENTKPQFRALARGAGLDFDALWATYEQLRSAWSAAPTSTPP